MADDLVKALAVLEEFLADNDFGQPTWLYEVVAEWRAALAEQEAGA